ncbi:ABC transporter ATP-binding protein [Bacillus sp. B1-b2]|uniref:ABC transporter ATP-binding protein n=1 Tax=Bacillus sp. B1-b2 TaxID=2653201 RepID=UPI0012617EC3|nr:ABC transporter ATP-binding protein [Bacillus sp. B1-b2]KAB7667291.1 ABC transporter ATP-binding protein [Bacillus sp. B1-b2]
MEIVQLVNVSKVINRTTLIKSLSLGIQEGEVFGLLGPNGAGKTTTIRMIVGLISITEGDIFILNKSVKTHYQEAMKNVGAIVENPEMYKFLSGYDNLIHYARMMNGIKKEKISEIVELVGLTDRIHDKVKTYSLGMRQRLGLAQSLLHDPKVLILDEPTNGLDPAGIREIRDYLRKLAKEKNMAIIVSSHLLSEMEMMCDRFAIIQNGKLVDVQAVSELTMKSTTALYEFDVHEPLKGKNILEESYPSIPVSIIHSTLQMTVEKEQVPELIKLLVESEVKIYGVRVKEQSLEERFFEVLKEGENT